MHQALESQPLYLDLTTLSSRLAAYCRQDKKSRLLQTGRAVVQGPVESRQLFVP
jgi:hypothetical protein